jgi:hypothetical protein
MGPELNAASVKFLLTDLDTALTFMDVADVTGLEETMQRNHANARKAYDTILHLMKKVTMTAQEQEEMHNKLALLKARLVAVGKL